MTTLIARVTNEVHELLEQEVSDEAALMRSLGVLCNKYGDQIVTYAIIRCTRIAYLRLKFGPRRS